jgi:ketosteroid isomerase-like protein
MGGSVVDGAQAHPPSSGLARRVLDALSRGDSAAFAALVHPDVEIHTARGVRRGRQEATEWAKQKYEHLWRFYRVDELHLAGGHVLVLGRVEYAWKEGREVADSTPIAIAMDFEHGLLRQWRFHDDPAEALKVFRAAVELRG